jgi:hypothetical protein
VFYFYLIFVKKLKLIFSASFFGSGDGVACGREMEEGDRP